MNEIVVNLIFAQQFLHMFFKHIIQLISHLKIKIFELPNTNTWTSSWIFLNIANLNLPVLPDIVQFNIKIYRKYLTQTIFVQHFVYPLCHHP